MKVKSLKHPISGLTSRSGNVIEWQYPRHVDLSGVEFKAMVSGSHNVDDDIVYVVIEFQFGQ